MFIVDCSDFTFIYLLRNKNDAFDMFRVLVTEVKKQSSKKVKRLRSDRETEYDLVAFNKFYNSKGIIHEKTAPYSLKVNGKAKRKNRILTKLVVVILLELGAVPS